MAPPDELTRRIAERVRKMRLERGFSLDMLAQRTGVSKGMLSQIERAASNPSVNVLWKVAAGLAVPFSKLLEDASPQIELVPAAERTRLGNQEGYGVEMLLSARTQHPIDVYEIVIEPACFHASDGHPPGTMETLVQLVGTLTLSLTEDNLTLRTGDAVRFSADVSHGYRNDGDQVSRTLCIITYSALD